MREKDELNEGAACGRRDARQPSRCTREGERQGRGGRREDEEGGHAQARQLLADDGDRARERVCPDDVRVVLGRVVAVADDLARRTAGREGGGGGSVSDEGTKGRREGGRKGETH